MWDYDLAKAIKEKPSNDFDRAWYKATYQGGSWHLMGGQLRFSGDKVRYCYQARWEPKLIVRKSIYDVADVELVWEERNLVNGLEAWVLLDKKQNRILILDVVG